MPRLARSLLTLIGWCSKKRRALRSAFYSCKFSSVGKKSYYYQNFLNIASNMQVESSATPLLTIDEVEKVQRQRIARSDMCSTLLIRLWLANSFNKLSWIAATAARKDSKERYFKRFVSCTCLRNASSYPLQQLLSFLTINVMRHLYPVSILLYAALVNTLYGLTSPHLHTNWLYNESPLTYYYKNTQKKYIYIGMINLNTRLINARNKTRHEIPFLMEQRRETS